MTSRTHFLINFALFQLAWFACVLGGANGLPVAGVLAVIIAVAVHLIYCRDPMSELRLIILVGLIGTAWDSLVVSAGLMAYPSGTFLAAMAPYWIIAMWVNFAVTINVSMSWLKGRLLLAAIFGGLGGPLSYLAGYKLGGVEIPDLWLGLGVQGIGWFFILPVLTLLAGRLNGVLATAGEVSGSELRGVTSNV